MSAITPTLAPTISAGPAISSAGLTQNETFNFGMSSSSNADNTAFLESLTNQGFPTLNSTGSNSIVNSAGSLLTNPIFIVGGLALVGLFLWLYYE
jgi:hypothetical protein